MNDSVTQLPVEWKKEAGLLPELIAVEIVTGNRKLTSKDKPFAHLGVRYTMRTITQRALHKVWNEKNLKSVSHLKKASQNHVYLTDVETNIGLIVAEMKHQFVKELEEKWHPLAQEK